MFAASSLRLPLTFDAASLQREVATIPDELWTPHFQEKYFEGEWSGVALRSYDGTVQRLFPHRNAGGVYRDTFLLERCPAMRAVIDAFHCDKEMIRLLRLGAGARILEHRDEKLNPERGVVRIHVPVHTNPDVYFFLDNERIVLGEGEAWYLDLSLSHHIENRGETERTHLVLDCLSNAWLRELLGRGVVA